MLEHFEALKNIKLDIPWSGLCEIDPVLKNEYLAKMAANPARELVTRTILNNTRYVSFEEMKRLLVEDFLRFKKAIGNKPFYAAVSTHYDDDLPLYAAKKYVFDNDSTEMWLLHLLYNNGLFDGMNFKGLYDKYEWDVNGSINKKIHTDAAPADILFLDDCILTNNKLNTVLVENKLDKKAFNLHLVTAIYGANMFGPYSLPTRNVFIYNPGDGAKIKFVDTLMEALGKNDPGSFKSLDEYNEYFNSRLEDLGFPREGCPIYFDHKISAESFIEVYFEGALGDGKNFGPLMKYSPNDSIQLLLREFIRDFNAGYL